MWKALVLCTLSLNGIASSQRYDPDRLRPAQMEMLVGGPIAMVRAGRWDEAVAALDAELRKTAGDERTSARARGDLDESFGVLVYSEGLTSDDPRLKAAAVPYLARAVASYRIAYGDCHPEVALALQSWADVLIGVDPDANNDRARGAYCEAFRIRMASLGPASAETGAALAEVVRLAPPGTIDPVTLAAIDRDSDINPAKFPDDPHDLEALLHSFADQIGEGRARRDRAYETLANDPRLIRLCPIP